MATVLLGRTRLSNPRPRIADPAARLYREAQHQGPANRERSAARSWVLWNCGVALQVKSYRHNRPSVSLSAVPFISSTSATEIFIQCFHPWKKHAVALRSRLGRRPSQRRVPPNGIALVLVASRSIVGAAEAPAPVVREDDGRSGRRKPPAPCCRAETSANPSRLLATYASLTLPRPSVPYTTLGLP